MTSALVVVVAPSKAAPSTGVSDTSQSTTFHSGKKCSFCSSHTLCNIQHAATTSGIRVMEMSFRFSRHRQRPFSLPKAFSTTILAELRVWVNDTCSLERARCCVKPLMSHRLKGYAASPIRCIGISTPSTNFDFSRGNNQPPCCSSAIWNKSELARTRES